MPRRDLLAPTLLILLFVVTRVVIYLMWRHPDAKFVANDVSYYGFHLDRLENGADDVMLEYPPPAVWLLHALYRLGGGWDRWFALHTAFFLLLDALVALSLYRRGRWQGSLFWILFTGANGAIVWFRFDLLPAALVAWACMWLVSRPRLAGAMVGVGAAIKLWPALLIAPMLAPDPSAHPARGRVVGFVAAGFGLAAISLAVEGWTRNTNPLTWQGDRGLQIESVPALSLMWLRTFTDNPSWHIELSEYNALEIFGPGVEALLAVAGVLTVLSFVATAGLAVLLIRRRSGPDAILLAVLSIILMTIIVNKTLSPQYILWLGGPVAALLLRVDDDRLRRHVHVLAVALVVVGGLTQFTYPWGAFGIMALPLGSGPETAVLVLRNLTLVAMTGYALWLTLRSSRTHALPELAKL
ncbi:MAG: DUF2029 domain-containing protein [Propionibacterium sp.]|nr:DUF2029 domain-containing protein [Propionibacterium sp.]